MNKKLLAYVFSLFLVLNFPASAYEQEVSGEKLCFVEGVMEEFLKEAAKETVNTVGKRLLNKYLDGKDADKKDRNSEENAQNQDNSDKTDS